ncbi:hypothetical protein [Clavibacter michiganensis]|uniref:hypothetical protein n=2 Tax=Clavibacter michiganensis TaxID=28447 RepID=UPI001430ACFB|nr:hypothetical protein [Clavibacter michiganensis]QIT13058.1 hypothetical protein GRD74_15860 [Clavibacter michiganensis subsp. michiganensis]
MSTLTDLLDDVRAQIEPDGDALSEARARLAFVRECGANFYGALRTYRSGSLAVHTMNKPVTDGDGGLVLNRNFYPGLGPEGTGEEAPTEVVDALCTHLGPLIRDQYPNAKIYKSERGPKILFGAPLSDGTDPTVDLVLALTRKDGAGIWIPNLSDDTWDASDPEKHASLFNSGLAGFRSTRRKITRLAKAWNKQYTNPGASSFEMSVWAYEYVEPNMGMAKGLWALFDGAATRLAAGDPTEDPAGVSDNLRLEIEASKMAVRLRKAAENLRRALDSDDDDEIRSAVSAVFWKYIESDDSATLVAAVTKLGVPVAAAALGVPVAATTAGASAARAYGASPGR